MPRQAEQEAYDLLPAAVRAALQDSVGGWDAVEAFAYLTAHSAEATIKWLRRRDGDLMRSGAFYLKGSDNLTFSTYLACKVKPLRASAQKAA